MKTQAETIGDLNARCARPDQFEASDRFPPFAHRAEGGSPKGRRLVETGAGKETGQGSN